LYEVPESWEMKAESIQLRAEAGVSRQREHGVHEAGARGISGSGESLPHLETIQQAFGHHDVRGVHAHQGASAKEACETMGAKAHAMGGPVTFRQAPALHSAAHEAAHVVQQRCGVQLEGGLGTVSDRYERHADYVADAVVRGRSAGGLFG